MFNGGILCLMNHFIKKRFFQDLWIEDVLMFGCKSLRHLWGSSNNKNIRFTNIIGHALN